MDFSELSQAAQDLIVNAVVGMYEGGPPEIPEEVKNELRQWTLSAEDAPKSPVIHGTVPGSGKSLLAKLVLREPFRAGDTVHHGPSGEDWILANDEEDGRVSPCGWPETIAEAKDCRLMEAASAEGRIFMLQQWAETGKGHEHEMDVRTRRARRQLAAE